MLLVSGLGFAGWAAARAARDAGLRVLGTARDPAGLLDPEARAIAIPFAAAGDVIRAATHLLVTAPPDESGDPVLAAHGAALAAAFEARTLRWVGYVSTTGVYGDRGGAEVDEATPAAPGQPRSRRRLAAEQAWCDATAGRVPLDLMRAGGIYGPGRSVFDDLRAGTARRVVKAGHAFSRIHRDDIALAVMAAIAQHRAPGPRVLHLVDDEPAEAAVVVAHAAALLGIAPPPAIPFETARATMSPMALSFWSENRRVANALTKAALGIAWRYPTYREGLEQIAPDWTQSGA